jgi:hypothetical protein
MMEDMGTAYKIFVGKPEGEKNVEDLGVNGKITEFE